MKEGYFIYCIVIQWFEEKDNKRMSNRLIANYIMFRDSKTKQWLLGYAKKKIKIMVKVRKKKGYKIYYKPKIEIKFYERETWCIGWFSHCTIDVGQSDEEVLKSFRAFVDRKVQLNLDNWHRPDERTCRNDRQFYQLMGAFDDWRWSGVDDNGNKTSPPCRCKHCKNQGLIRINH